MSSDVVEPSRAVSALLSLTRRWPYRGAPALVSTLYGAAARPRPGTWVVSPGGGLCPPMELDLSIHWHRELYFFPKAYGRFYLERPLARFMQSRLREGSHFLDVGANVGFFTMHGAGLVGPTGRVVAFEPEPTTFASVQRSVALNGLSQVSCAQVALSDHEGTAAFHRSADGTANSLIAEVGSRSNRYDQRVDVKVTTLDKWNESGVVDPSKLALVKVDVEGEEARTLAGMKATLTASGAAVWCEVRGPRGSTRAPNTSRAVAEVLAPLGYLPHRFDTEAVRVDAGDVQGREDILFLRK